MPYIECQFHVHRIWGKLFRTYCAKFAVQYTHFMSVKNQIKNKKQWAKVPIAKRKKMMAAVVKSRWDAMSEDSRKLVGKKLALARKLKAKQVA